MCKGVVRGHWYGNCGIHFVIQDEHSQHRWTMLLQTGWIQTMPILWCGSLAIIHLRQDTQMVQWLANEAMPCKAFVQCSTEKTGGGWKIAISFSNIMFIHTSGSSHRPKLVSESLHTFTLKPSLITIPVNDGRRPWGLTPPGCTREELRAIFLVVSTLMAVPTELTSSKAATASRRHWPDLLKEMQTPEDLGHICWQISCVTSDLAKMSIIV